MPIALSSLDGRLKVQNEPKGLFAAHELNSAELIRTDLQQVDPVTRRVRYSHALTRVSVTATLRID